MSRQTEYWTVERKRSVVTMLIGLRESGIELRRAIDSLHRGGPSDAHQVQGDPETWEWLEARFWITFIAERERKWIYVTDVESASIA